MLSSLRKSLANGSLRQNSLAIAKSRRPCFGMWTWLNLNSRLHLADVSDTFYLFRLGGGEGGVRSTRKGGRWFSIDNPRQGGSARRAWGGVVGRVSAGKFGGGGANFFFRAEVPTKHRSDMYQETKNSGCLW